MQKIYAQNGKGKTTLSKLLANNFNNYVLFNEDSINEFIFKDRIENNRVTAIFNIKDNIIKNERLDIINDTLLSLVDKESNLVNDLKKIEEDLETHVNYSRREFNKLYNSYLQDIKKYKTKKNISADDLLEFFKNERDINKKTLLVDIDLLLSKIKKISKLEVDNNLNLIDVILVDKLKSYKNNLANLNKLLTTSIELNTNNKININDLIELKRLIIKYKEYITADTSNIDRLIEEYNNNETIKNQKNQLIERLNKAIDFYSYDFSSINLEFSYNFKSLITILKSKVNNLSITDTLDINYYTNEINKLIEYIECNNDEYNSFEFNLKNKKELIDNIEKLYLDQIYLSLSDKKNEILKLTDNLSTLKKSYNSIIVEIENLKNEKSLIKLHLANNILLKYMNDILLMYSNNKLTIELDNNNYSIKVNNKNISLENLSSSEKVIIAFAYFLASNMNSEHVLLLDDLLTHLDNDNKIKMLEFLVSLEKNSKFKNILLFTNDSLLAKDNYFNLNEVNLNLLDDKDKLSFAKEFNLKFNS